jgi:hypothetical protein
MVMGGWGVSGLFCVCWLECHSFTGNRGEGGKAGSGVREQGSERLCERGAWIWVELPCVYHALFGGNSRQKAGAKKAAWLSVLLSHPNRKGRGLDGAPSVSWLGWIFKGNGGASLTAEWVKKAIAGPPTFGASSRFMHVLIAVI